MAPRVTSGYFQTGINPRYSPLIVQDDYVKFLRFAQWKIEQAGEGIVGMITNHGYLDNPTFRGMRQSLMRTFDQIHVLNLHGNSLKKETCPDGSKDENVFDIRQGVAICLMVKYGKSGSTSRKKDENASPVIRHADLYGLRETKYDWLDKHAVQNTKWEELRPASPLYLLVQRDDAAAIVYDKALSVPTIFPVNSVGIITARDHFVIDLDLAALKRRIETFRKPDLSDEIVAKMLQLADTNAWNLHNTRIAFQNDKDWQNTLTHILYRPFDCRHFCYHSALLERGREEVMKNMVQDNLALSTTRSVETGLFTHVLCANSIITHHTVSLKEVNYLFPLYVYPDQSRGDLFAHASGGKRVPNFPDWLLPKLNEAYGADITPENVFHYIYAVLYSPPYREKYNEFLKTDFPRIPFTAEAKVFQGMAKVGAELIALHLLKSPKLDSPGTRFHGKGDNLVAKNTTGGRLYDPKAMRVYINKEQYFDNIPENLWEYQIGGYRVLDKWLKDRAERRLSADDVRHYCRVATALSETMRLQRELTDEYSRVERQLMSFDKK